MKNQPAFPRTGFWPSQTGGDIESIRERMGSATEPENGMTLRQYSAIHILQGILAANEYADPVAAAVKYTDELLKALEQ